MSETEQTEMEEFADILAKTGTKQAEWAIGVRGIAGAVGITTTNPERIPDGLPLMVVKNMWPGKQKTMLIAYRPALADWKAKQDQAAAAQNGHVEPPSELEILSNRVALLEKATHANTDLLKQVAYDVRTLLDEWRNPA